MHIYIYIYILRRTVEKAREKRENFSPVEMQENQITPTVGDIDL